MLLAEMTKYEDGHGFFVRILEKIPICLRHFYFKTVQSILNLHTDKTEYVMVSCKIPKIVKRALLFDNEQYVEFENKMFPTVANFDEYLRVNYGNWREDLPPEQQRGHDLTLGDIEWKTEE